MMTDKRILQKSNSESLTLDLLANLSPLNEFYQQFTAPVFTEYFTNAMKNYQSFPMPGRKDEAWRRTPLNDLDLASFSVDFPILNFPVETIALDNSTIAGEISLTPGGIINRMNFSLTQSGLIFCDLETAMRDHSQLLSQKLGKIVPSTDGKFAALSSAMATKGVFLYVPPGLHIEAPLNIKVIQQQSNSADFFHFVVWMDDQANADITLEIEAPDFAPRAQSFTGGIVEIELGMDASLDFTEVQNLSKDAWVFTHERVRINENGKLNWVYGGLGSRLAKSFMCIDLIGENAEAKMGGFFLGNGKQHLDFVTQQNHLAPNSKSDLLFKGAVKGQSRSVWQGMIKVAKDAKASDGYQKSDNLVLSEQARASAIPGLEILNNDVRCSHGATVSKLSQDELFYLQTRGIDVAEGEKLLLKGFFSQISGMIKNPKMQEQVEKLIDERIT